MNINRDGDVDVGLRPGQTDVNGARLLLPNLNMTLEEMVPNGDLTEPGGLGGG